jgi:hypothetical protein
MHLITLCLALAFSATTLAAQNTEPTSLPPDPENPIGQEGAMPPGWLVRLDHPDTGVKIGGEEDADIWFVTMTPGWHVTTKPAGIFYHPAAIAEGTYQAQSTIHLFDPGQRNEAYGIFFGGQNLQDDHQTYLYFLIRRSGEYLVKQRQGHETRVLIDWTPYDGILKYEDDTQGSVENTLSVTVDAKTITFYINGAKVANIARGSLSTDGVVGLRLNHNVNVHISDLRIE